MVTIDKRIGTTWLCFDCAADDNGTWAKYRVTLDCVIELDEGVAAFSKQPCGTCATTLAGARFRGAIWNEGGK
jgi:hypothetical protein